MSENIFINEKIKRLPPEFFALVNTAGVPNGAYRITAAAPWQTLLWVIYRWFFALCVLFLGGVFVYAGTQGATDLYWKSIFFWIPGGYIAYRGWIKFQEWRSYNKQYLLFLPEYFVERKQNRATIIPWKKITGAHVITPDSDKGVYDPFVAVEVGGENYPIFAGKPVNPIYGSTGPAAIYNLIPGAMAFSPEQAYYTENALAIKNKVLEFCK